MGEVLKQGTGVVRYVSYKDHSVRKNRLEGARCKLGTLCSNVSKSPWQPELD